MTCFPGGCAFWGVVDYANYLGCHIPKNLFWGIFMPNTQSIKAFILSKLLRRFQPNFAEQ